MPINPPSAVAEIPSVPRIGLRPADEDLHRRYAELRQRLAHAEDGERVGLERQLIETRNQIAEANTGLLWRVAGEVGRQFGRPASELLTDGYFGLVKAIEGFDPARGVRFSTYAWKAIRHAILGPLTREIKRGQHYHQEPDAGLESQAVDRHDDISELTRNDQLEAALARLTPREQRIFRGLRDGKTLAGMAAEEGISRQRMWQIARRAASKAKSVQGRVRSRLGLGG